MVDSFLMLRRVVLECDGMISPNTGEFIELSLHDKIVYTFMVDRHKLFGTNHFESINTIADRMRVSKTTVASSLNKLKEHGVISATKVKNKRGGRERWVYNNINESIKFYREGVIISDDNYEFEF